MLAQIDSVIRDSLIAFVDDVFRSAWKGREREAISLYAFGYLQTYATNSGVLNDATQIGIEVTVPSDRSLNPKGRVCKDLVLWRAPRMTCWNADWEAVNYPLAIMEWKAFRLPTSKPHVSQSDVDWLRQYSVHCLSAFVGYAVGLDLLQRQFRISVTRVERGHAQEQWLEVSPEDHPTSV